MRSEANGKQLEAESSLRAHSCCATEQYSTVHSSRAAVSCPVLYCRLCNKHVRRKSAESCERVAAAAVGAPGDASRAIAGPAPRGTSAVTGAPSSRRSRPADCAPPPRPTRRSGPRRRRSGSARRPAALRPPRESPPLRRPLRANTAQHK